MPEDFRVSTAFRTSRKRKRLLRTLGHPGVTALLDLWSYCAAERPDGDLTGLAPRDIADEVDWDGDPVDLVEALCDCGFIDIVNSDACVYANACERINAPGASVRLHGWEERQPWVSTSTARSEAARRSAHERWASKGRCKGDTPNCDDRCPKPTISTTNKTPTEHRTKAEPSRNANACDRNANAYNRNAPTPIPIPKPDREIRISRSASGGVNKPEDPHKPKRPRPPKQPLASPPIASLRLPEKLEAMPDNEKVPLAGLDALLSDAGALQGVGQGVGPLARLQPILAWELREAINAAIGHRPDGKILAYLARVIENVRKEKRTPAPRPAEGETDDERRKRIRAQQRREQEELEAYMAKAVPCPPELRLGAPSPGGSTPGGG